MNINETVTDLDYIKTEILKISNQHGISFDDLMDEFTNLLLVSDMISEEILDGIRRRMDKKPPKTI